MAHWLPPPIDANKRRSLAHAPLGKIFLSSSLFPCMPNWTLYSSNANWPRKSTRLHRF